MHYFFGISPRISVAVPVPVLVACLLLHGFAASGLHAETVAEWKFESTTDQAAGSVATLDLVREGASDQSRLSDHAKIVANSTGIGSAWKPFLASGYLEAQPGGGIPATGMVEINKHGLYTQPNQPQRKNAAYSSYFGFSGLGQGNLGDGAPKGGTVYLVLSPLDDFKEGTRYGFMGTGHVGDGEIQLGIDVSGELKLKIGNRESINATVNRKWKSRRWYFIAASWREDAVPVLYVREMDGNGPAASPKASPAKAEFPTPAFVGPSHDPLVIGAHWFNPGAKASTVYGAGARIAYARFDNSFSTQEQIEKTFESLGATP